MTDQDALLRAVRAHPDDDTPRLVYADWLDEHGDPRRAEFVRVQCRIARADDDRPDSGFPSDVFRQYELWRVNGRTWAAGLPGGPGPAPPAAPARAPGPPPTRPQRAWPAARSAASVLVHAR